MSNYCKYHPLEDATWKNARSGECYCDKCVDESEREDGGCVKSLVMGEELENLGAAHNAIPFWEVLPEMFSFPFQRNVAMLFIPLIVLGGGLIQLGGVLPMVVLVGLFAIITKYGFSIILAATEGGSDAPTIQNAMKDGYELLVQRLAIQLSLGACVYAVSMLGSGILDAFVLALVIFVLPASIMLFAIEEDVNSAINPSALMAFVGRIGWAYMVLYTFIFLLAGVCAGLMLLFIEEVSEAIMLTILMVSSLYFLLVIYRMLGYAVFQYQGVLGFVSKASEAKERRRRKYNIADAKIDAYLKEGRYEKVLTLLQKELRVRAGSIQIHERLSKLLCVMGDKKRYQEHGNAYMKAVYDIGDESRLYFLYCQYHDDDKSFVPSAPEIRHRIAEQFYQRGKHKEALALLSNLHKDAPGYLGIPNAYLLMATVLFEGVSNPKKALQFLGFIKQNYPDFTNKEDVVALAINCKKAIG